jgi:hypothetical protein
MSADLEAYVPGAEDWDALTGSADEVVGHELISGEAADKLIGVPFVITRVIFREGVQRPKTPYRDDYVSCEAVVAPQEILVQRARRGRLDLDEISVDPGEHIIFNDGSTGIYRQIVQYLEAKGLIRLPDGPDVGGKGESRFDLPRTQWDEGDEAATSGINIRLLCPRGLRYSEYTNEYNPDGSKTRYIA